MIGSEELPPFMQSWPSLVIMMIFLIVNAELGISEDYDDKHLILNVIFDTLKFHELELKVWHGAITMGSENAIFLLVRLL